MPPKEKRIAVLLVEDHVMVREGLRLMLEQTNFEIVGEAEERSDALAQAEKNQPQLILLDLQLKNEYALDFLPQLLKAAPAARIVILTASDTPAEHRRALLLGAWGIVRKDQASSVLLQAMERVLAGEKWLGMDLMEALVSGGAASKKQSTRKSRAVAEKISLLSEREQQIINLSAREFTIEQIAARLHLSESMVRHHLKQMYRIFGVKGHIGLVLYAQRHGLLKEED